MSKEKKPDQEWSDLEITTAWLLAQIRLRLKGEKPQARQVCAI